MTTDQSQQMPDLIREHHNRLLAVGLLTCAAALTAMALPFISRAPASLVFGGVLVAAGTVFLSAVTAVGRGRGLILTALLTALPLAAGLDLLAVTRDPGYWPGPVVGVLLLVQGPLKAALGLSLKPARLWAWPAWSGLTSVVMGLAALLGLPATESWGLGMILGLDLLHFGWCWIMISLANRDEWD